MSKPVFTALQVLGMVLTAVFGQAAIRSLFNHDTTQLWGIVDWVPGGWGGRLAALVVLTAASVVFAGWAHDNRREKDTA